MSTSTRWEKPRSRRAGHIPTRPCSQPTCTTSPFPTAPKRLGRDGEGLEEICIDRRLGLSALGGRRSQEAAGDRRRQTMLCMSPAEKRPGLPLFHLHSVKRG